MQTPYESPLPYGITLYSDVTTPRMNRNVIERFNGLAHVESNAHINGKPITFKQATIDTIDLARDRILRSTHKRVRAHLDTYLEEHVACDDLRKKLSDGCYSLQPRIKQYSPGDEFPLHSDNSSVAALSRTLAWILYLNDDFTGGHTVFYSGQGEIARVQPQNGSLLVFPVHSIYMHAGEPVERGTKTILNGFMTTITSQARAAAAALPQAALVAREIGILCDDLICGASIVFEEPRLPHRLC